MLNLVRNAETALAGTPGGKVRISAKRTKAGVDVAVLDNGPGVQQPELLFDPFRTGYGKGGFGLYLSRAMMLSFQGDLRYEPSEQGALFVVEIVATETTGARRS